MQEGKQATRTVEMHLMHVHTVVHVVPISRTGLLHLTFDPVWAQVLKPRFASYLSSSLGARNPRWTNRVASVYNLCYCVLDRTLQQKCMASSCMMPSKMHTPSKLQSTERDAECQASCSACRCKCALQSSMIQLDCSKYALDQQKKGANLAPQYHFIFVVTQRP